MNHTPHLRLRPLAAALLLAAPMLASAQTFNVGRDFNNSGNIRGSFAVGGTLNHSAGTFTVTGPSTAGNVRLGDTLAFDPAAGFTEVTVRDRFESQNGTLVFNTALAGDDSKTDRLVVQGATAGSAKVVVNNAGGAGAQTANGIRLIEVGGASDGVFKLDGRVVAGAYEYKLHKGGRNTPNDGDWYLRSQSSRGGKPAPAPAPVTTPGGTGGGATVPWTPVYRPEGGAYLANQAASVGLFQQQMHDRMGEPDFARGDKAAPAVWARVSRHQVDSHAGYDQLDVSSDASLLQVGAELATWSGGNQRLHFGAMAAAGRADNHVGSPETGYHAKSRVRGYAGGLYATWFGSADSQAGAYADGWVQYGRFDNRVTGDALAAESYDASSWSASLEGGYTFQLASTGKFDLFLQPQAQAIYTDYDADDHVEANGTRVHSSLSGSLVTRAGLRLFGNSGDAAHNRVQPFLMLNWWRSDKAGVVSLDADRIGLALPRDRYEAKLGVQAQLGGGWTGWGNWGWQTGRDGYRDVGGQLGVNYRW